jgi:hypothetical protein
MKYTLFILMRDDIIAVDFTKLFFKYIEYYFGTPRNIVSDHDS